MTTGEISIASLVALSCLATGTLLAQGGGPGPAGTSGGSGGTTQQVSLSIPNEMAPPGGLVQMKFNVTEPTPISTGRTGAALDTTTFDTVCGIALFSPGDVNGVAMIGGSSVSIAYITSSGAQGTDYPIMTMALHVRPDVLPGTQSQFGLDPNSTWTLGTLGTATLKPMNPAIVAVGGTISITDISPGGGTLPAGTTVSILGIGFEPNTQVQLNAIKFSSIQFVSSQEIQFTLAETTNMTGQKIQVVNPDGSQDTYFSYMRGIPLGQSNQSLLSSAVPIFSSMAYSMALFSPIMPATGTQFTGLAMQNPNLTSTAVTVALYSSANNLLGSSTTMLPSANTVTREISELVQGAALAAGSYVVVSATQPIQVFGFTGDYQAGSITPFTAIVTQP